MGSHLDQIRELERGGSWTQKRCKLAYVSWLRYKPFGEPPIKVRVMGYNKVPRFRRELLEDDFNRMVEPVVANVLIPIENALRGALLDEERLIEFIW